MLDFIIQNKKMLFIAFFYITILTTLVYLIWKQKTKWLFIIFYLLLVVMGMYFFKSKIKIISLFIVCPSLLIGSLIALIAKEDKADDIFDVPFLTKKGTRFIRNIKRGVLIFGSAGSGKTASPIYALLKHLAEKNFAGVVYDYKDGELSEICLPLFKDRLQIIAIHKPYIGNRINILSSKYIRDETDINEIVSVIMSNLGTTTDKKDFFTETAEALLTAIILKFHLDHQEYCTIPHIIAFILAVDFSEENPDKRLGEEASAVFEKLKKFLLSNVRVQMQASSFIMGLASERQTAAVLSTLSNSLRKLAFPEAFWVLSGDDIDLNINDPKINKVLCVINEPKTDSFLTPIIACIIHTTTKMMMERDRNQSFLLLDEAPTIKLHNMAKIPATMRSFGVATIYCAQDLVQGKAQYGDVRFKEITANLSTQFFGKANDPDTAKFYEGFFEIIKEKTTSTNIKGAGGGFLGTTNSTTLSEKERTKVRANDFLKLKTGQFAFLSDGKSEIVQFHRYNIETKKLDTSRDLSTDKYYANFLKIIEDVKNIIKDH